jgi:hypothetical protein
MKPGQACCCLMMARPAKVFQFKKGDPPCLTGGCAPAAQTIGQARPELLPEAQAFVEPKFTRPLALNQLALSPYLPDKAPEKIPLAS